MKEKLFTKKETIFLLAVGLVMGFRELSMTMVNPFITIYGKELLYNTPFLCGLGLGIYGLTNAVFQIPYGLWSDIVGRKKVILTGLLQLSIGLFVAFIAKNIYVFIFARALQGSGAVMAIAYSWIGDNIPDNKKDRAIGISGTIVGIGAVGAFAIGPMLYKLISVTNMFLSCSIIIFLTAGFITFFIPEKITNKEKDNILDEKAEIVTSKANVTILKNNLKMIIGDKVIFKLSICGFIINFIMATIFLIVPDVLQKLIGAQNMWQVFLPAVIIGIITMGKMTILSDRGLFVETSLAEFLILLVGTICILKSNLIFISIGTIFIITGFICLNSQIPSTINKLTDKEYRGTANGFFQTFTFLGFCFGPTIAGFLQEKNLDAYVFYISILLSIIGVFISIILRKSFYTYEENKVN